MDKARPGLATGGRDKTYGIPIDTKRGDRIGLGLVDGGVSGTVDAPVGAGSGKKGLNSLGIIDSQLAPVGKEESQVPGLLRQARGVSRKDPGRSEEHTSE